MSGPLDETRETRWLGVGGPRLIAAAAAFPPLLVAAGLADAELAADASHAPRALVAAAGFVTEFGTSGYMFACSALVAAIAIVALGRGHALWGGTSPRLAVERSIFFFAAIAASGVAAQAVKHLLGRGRPALSGGADPFVFRPLSLAHGLDSFPSGHTTSAFAAAVALGSLFPRWRKQLLGCAVLIGTSRVVVGAHYPSDVVGGAALGSLAAIAVAWACARHGLAFTPVAGRILPKRSGGTRGSPDPARAGTPPRRDRRADALAADRDRSGVDPLKAE